MRDRVILGVGGIACRVLARVHQEIGLFPQTTPYLKRLLVAGYDSDARAHSELLTAIPGASVEVDEHSLEEKLGSMTRKTEQITLALMNISSSRSVAVIPVLKRVIEDTQNGKILLMGFVDGSQQSNDDGSMKAQKARACVGELESQLSAYRDRYRLCLMHRNAFGEAGVMETDAKDGFMELVTHVLWLLLTCRKSGEDILDAFFTLAPAATVLALGHRQTDVKTGHTTTEAGQTYNWLSKGVSGNSVEKRIVFGTPEGIPSHLVDIIDEVALAPGNVEAAIANLGSG